MTVRPPHGHAQRLKLVGVVDQDSMPYGPLAIFPIQVLVSWLTSVAVETWNPRLCKCDGFVGPPAVTGLHDSGLLSIVTLP